MTQHQFARVKLCMYFTRKIVYLISTYRSKWMCCYPQTTKYMWMGESGNVFLLFLYDQRCEIPFIYQKTYETLTNLSRFWPTNIRWFGWMYLRPTKVESLLEYACSLYNVLVLKMYKFLLCTVPQKLWLLSLIKKLVQQN